MYDTCGPETAPTIFASRWNYTDGMFESTLVDSEGEYHEFHQLVPGEVLPDIECDSKYRRCTYGAFDYFDRVCWEPTVSADELIDSFCPIHIDIRSKCTIGAPGDAVGLSWSCKDTNPACDLYNSRCSIGRKLYLGVFSNYEKVGILKLGETDDVLGRAVSQGLAAVIPLFRSDGSSMSLPTTKSLESKLEKAITGLSLGGNFFRLETRPYAAPYKRKDIQILLSFLAPDLDKSCKLLSLLGEKFVAALRSNSDPDLRNLALGDVVPVEHNEELVDAEHVRKISLDDEIGFEITSPRNHILFCGEIISGKPPQIITYSKNHKKGKFVNDLLSLNPLRFNGLAAQVKEHMSQESLVQWI